MSECVGVWTRSIVSIIVSLCCKSMAVSIFMCTGDSEVEWDSASIRPRLLAQAHGSSQP